MTRSRFATAAPLVVPAVGFAGWCLVLLARDPAPRRLPKPVWAALIAASMPGGGIAYLVLGRSGRG